MDKEKSNYEIMKNRMAEKFTVYDQIKMISKFDLYSDDSYIYISFILRKYRINRNSGQVTWSEDSFITEHKAGFNEAMTIYDVLCCSTENCKESGRRCSPELLRGNVYTGNIKNGGSFFQSTADKLSGKTEDLKIALNKMGDLCCMSGDAAAIIRVFDFITVSVQFWDGDDEFSPFIKYMVDEEIQEFMHFETVMFMLSHLSQRILEEIERLNN